MSSNTIGSSSEMNPDQSWLQKSIETIGQFSTISQMMRIIGAIIVTSALSVFLVQGWELGNDTSRYWDLLKLTLLLAFSGFALYRWVKENKGARMFFSLCLIAIVANFTILGALVYSVIQLDGQLGQYPDIAQWVSEASTLGLTLAGSAVILVPLSFLVFTILARRSNKLLTGTFLLANLALLMPVREAWMVGLLATIVVLMVLAALRLISSEHTLHTVEGRFARFMLFVPAGILFARSLIFYGVDELVLLLLSSMLYLIIRELGKGVEKSGLIEMLLIYLSVPLALCIAASTSSLLHINLGSYLEMIIFALVYAALSFELSRRADADIQRDILAFQAVMISGFTLLVAMTLGGTVETVVALVAGVGLLMAGYFLGRKLFSVAGVVLIAASVMLNFEALINLFDFNNWAVLAALGGSIIILASVLDRHGPGIKLKLAARKQRQLTA